MINALALSPLTRKDEQTKRYLVDLPVQILSFSNHVNSKLSPGQRRPVFLSFHIVCLAVMEELLQIADRVILYTWGLLIEGIGVAWANRNKGDPATDGILRIPGMIDCLNRRQWSQQSLPRCALLPIIRKIRHKDRPRLRPRADSSLPWSKRVPWSQHQAGPAVWSKSIQVWQATDLQL